MPDQAKSGKPGRIWKWARRIIVILFLMVVVVGSGALTYVIIVNHLGHEALQESMAELRARALPLGREQTYRAAGNTDQGAGHLYLAAFQLALGGRDRYVGLPYVSDRRDPPVCKPVGPELAGKLRAFSGQNRRYFALLEEARLRQARIPLLDFHQEALGQSSPVSGARDAVRRYLLPR